LAYTPVLCGWQKKTNQDILKRGIPFIEQFAPVIFGSSRDAVISARIYQSQSVKEELGRKMHVHPGSRGHLRPSFFKLTSL